MDELEKSAHKVYKIKYHFVFCIKYRKDLFLQNKYVETFKYLCRGMGERYSMKFETIGFEKIIWGGASGCADASICDGVF